MAPEARFLEGWVDMRWEGLFWGLLIVFCVVLTLRLKEFYQRPLTVGFLVNVGHFDPPENCEFSRPLVLDVSAHHSLRLNEEPVSEDRLSWWLDLILKEREKPILYVDGNPEVSMQELIQTLDSVPKLNEKMEIRLITPGNRKESCADFPPRSAS
jgi:biopolymer transport protein ExbD